MAGIVLVGLLAGFTSSGTSSSTSRNGKVTVVYHDDAIKPENQQAVAVIRKSGVFEQVSGWVSKSLALPHDLVIDVTDNVPPGVTDAVTQADGRTIFVPAAFLTELRGVSNDVVTTVSRPAVVPADKFNTDNVYVLSMQFIFGHEMGHALQRQLLLPNLGLEEDAADGFPSFYTINEVGPDPTLAAAIVFDEIARKSGQLTLEGLSTDHPVTQARVFNFLAYLDGSDPQKYDSLLIDTGYLPKSRAPLAPQEWAALNYGWWTQLQPYFSQGFKAQGAKAQQKAGAQLKAVTVAFAKNLDQIRTGQITTGSGAVRDLGG